MVKQNTNIIYVCIFQSINVAAEKNSLFEKQRNFPNIGDSAQHQSNYSQEQKQSKIHELEAMKFLQTFITLR